MTGSTYQGITYLDDYCENTSLAGMKLYAQVQVSTSTETWDDP